MHALEGKIKKMLEHISDWELSRNAAVGRSALKIKLLINYLAQSFKIAGTNSKEFKRGKEYGKRKHEN